VDPSLDDLIALVKARGTASTFPAPEELHALLDPFRTLLDQESLRLALAATVRKSERLVARVASEALAYLGGMEAGPLLIGIATDASLGTSQRAAAVWAMDRHLPAFRDRLTAEEQVACISLPVLELLEDPEADDGFGLRALLNGYTTFPAESRGSFLSALGVSKRERGHDVASLCMQLLAVEDDPERRRTLLDLTAGDETQRAADLLATFAAKATSAEEAKHARRHLHLLRAKGLRGVARADMQDARAFITGVDGDACYTINIVIPRMPTFDFANLLVHLSSGIRDGFVMQSLPRQSVDDMAEKIKEGCGGLAGYVPMALAARMVDDAIARTKSSVLSAPDVAKPIALAEPALAVGRGQPWSDLASSREDEVQSREVHDLLESPEFESWFFEARERTVQKSMAILQKPIRSKGKTASRTLANRVEKACADLTERLQADGEPARLGAMLTHQSRLYATVGNHERAQLCRTLATEVEKPDSRFLIAMATRSILRALETGGRGEDETIFRFADAREHLRARIESTEPRHRKADVALLDLAAVAHAELNMRNREQASARRAALTIIEDAALEVGQELVAWVTAGRDHSPLVEVRRVLSKHALADADDMGQLASEIIESAKEFTQTLCERACPHHCFDDLGGDGRTAFYADGLPWEDAPVRSPRRKHNA
jgi:hypothetical protein